MIITSEEAFIYCTAVFALTRLVYAISLKKKGGFTFRQLFIDTRDNTRHLMTEYYLWISTLLLFGMLFKLINRLAGISTDN